MAGKPVSSLNMDAQVRRYLSTGDYDSGFTGWPGRNVVEAATQGSTRLREALIAEVTARTRSPAKRPLMDPDVIRDLTRTAVGPMVAGLFPPPEQPLVLAVLDRSVVFLTPENIEQVLWSERWLHTAWSLANLYLAGIGADRLAADTPEMVGLSEETTCYVSTACFDACDPFADFIVHEVAHIFYNCKRVTAGLPATRAREWLLDIEFRKRETFAYACEAYSRQARSAESKPVPAALANALSDIALQRASSAAIFRRGRTYASSGAVEVLAEDTNPTPAIHAQVTGTDIYTTDVWIEDEEATGSCDCPNAEDGWFCKHQVAVALIWRDRLSGQTSAIDEAARKKVEASAKRAQTAKDRREALRVFLHGLPASALAAKLLDTLAVLCEDLSEPGAYSEVTRFLERHRRTREAFANAEQAYKAFPDHWRLQEDLLRCYKRDGWTEEAYALRRRQFDGTPSVERYHQVLRAGAAAGRDNAALSGELLKELEAREIEDVSRSAPAGSFATRRREQAPSGRDVTLRAEVLCSEGR
ncbi:MAG: SWIM zinc finger family protein [Betaproteobacteria bacterium]|nr:SWIM zinc finger family protein [Betaproteobacteria bacterium]